MRRGSWRSGTAPAGAVGEELGQLAVLFGDLGEGFGGRLPIEADRAGALLQLARQEERRQRGRHVVEDALATLLLALDALPLAAHLGRRLGDVVAEDVRVAADQLDLDRLGYRAQVADLPLLRGSSASK